MEGHTYAISIRFLVKILFSRLYVLRGNIDPN